jgi:hypothetical protein
MVTSFVGPSMEDIFEQGALRQWDPPALDLNRQFDLQTFRPSRLKVWIAQCGLDQPMAV